MNTDRARGITALIFFIASIFGIMMLASPIEFFNPIGFYLTICSNAILFWLSIPTNRSKAGEDSESKIK